MVVSYECSGRSYNTTRVHSIKGVLAYEEELFIDMLGSLKI